MYKICFFVPPASADAVKAALFAAGAGKIGNYSECCWQTAGRGQFRPLAGSHPAIGNTGSLENLEELKVEMVCDDDCIKPAIQALRSAHPYETPAFEYWRINDA